MKPETQEWLDIAKEDYESSQILFREGKPPQSVYFACQAVEKVLKAAQLELTNQAPKKSHHLENLAYKTRIKFSDHHLKTLRELTNHYDKVRYPDYRRAKYNTRTKVEPILSQSKEMYQWILTALSNR
jgi:HEPN domain-containing protein